MNSLHFQQRHTNIANPSIQTFSNATSSALNITGLLVPIPKFIIRAHWANIEMSVSLMWMYVDIGRN